MCVFLSLFIFHSFERCCDAIQPDKQNNSNNNNKLIWQKRNAKNGQNMIQLSEYAKNDAIIFSSLFLNVCVEWENNLSRVCVCVFVFLFLLKVISPIQKWHFMRFVRIFVLLFFVLPFVHHFDPFNRVQVLVVAHKMSGAYYTIPANCNLMIEIHKHYDEVNWSQQNCKPFHFIQFYSITRHACVSQCFECEYMIRLQQTFVTFMVATNRYRVSSTCTCILRSFV